MKIVNWESRRRIPPHAVCWLHACIFFLLSGVSQGSTLGFLAYDWEAKYSADYLRGAADLDSSVVHKVYHDPAGPTLNHDYYARHENKDIHQLVALVEGAHVNKILPNLRKSFTAPDTLRKGFLNAALAEIKYTLGRLVNHPKALALSATVTKLLGRPNLPITYYQRALKMYPQRAFTQAQFGNFLVDVGEIEQGIERLTLAIKIDPKLAVAYGWLAWAYHKHGEMELAAEYSKKAKDKGFKGKLPKTQS